MMGWGSGMGMGGWGLLGGLALLLFVGGLIVVGVIVIAAITRSRGAGPRLEAGPPASRGGNAVTILKERYARGEISREEYQSVMDDLTSG